MKKVFIILSVIIALLSVISCGKRDSEYFKVHPEEMKQKMEECKKMSSAEAMADRECAAISLVNSEHFFKKTIQRPGEGKGQGTRQY